ncbi:MAG: CAP domain-containing protein [Anaerolineales bacterium]|nr:CAP domain-containing protein [Anaerolineales bacterium]
MNKKIKNALPFLLIVALLSACISVETEETPAPVAPKFITATLPPTKSGYVPPTPTATLESTLAPTLPPVTADPNCTDSAVFVRDVTVPDGMKMKAGEAFVKTWELINNGTCTWAGYVVKFESGDRMNAPLSAPIADTPPKKSVEISVSLTAPSADGSYTGNFSIHDASGKSVPIGTERTFWVKITVGASTNLPTTPSAPNATLPPVSGGGANCNYSTNAGYVNQIASLINQERANAGLPALTVNAQLESAAQSHAADMACNGMISHAGSDGSSVRSRVAAAGYAASYVEEIIYGGGGPQAALTWWMSDQIHRDAILSVKSAEMGVGYAYFSNGSYGDFIAVDFGSP